MDQVPYGDVEPPAGPGGAPFGARSTAAEVVLFVAWRVATVVAIGLVVGALQVVAAPLGAVAVLMSLIFLPAVAGMMRQVRLRRGLAVLGYLEQAVRMNLPLPAMLAAARDSESGAVRRRLSRLTELLRDGAPLELALPAAVPEIGPRALSIIASGERLGQLGAALRRLVVELRQGKLEDATRDAFATWYPLAVASVMVTVIGFVLVFVMPKFEQIFMDFAIRLPEQTVTLLRVSRWAVEYGFGAVLVPMALVIALGGAARVTFDARAGWFRPAPLDYVVWHIPIAGGVVRDRALADAFAGIAAALRSGRDLGRAVEEASTLRVNAVARGRLRAWAEELARGTAPDEAARRAGMPKLVRSMVGPAAGSAADGMARAAEFLAGYYAARFSRAAELARGAIVPAMVLVFGALVLGMVAGMYLPLVRMIDYLTERVLLEVH